MVITMAADTDPSGIRYQLNKGTTRAWGYNLLLEEMLLHPGQYGYKPVAVATSKLHAPIPWNDSYAVLVMDLHAMARELELKMLEDLRRRTQPHRSPVRATRGGSSDNTKLALTSVSRLSHAMPDQMVRDAIHSVTTWVWRAEVALSIIEQPRHLPREVGQSEPRCPWCTYQTLRLHPSSWQVGCINPACQDNTGQRPIGQLSYNPETLLAEILWRPGAIVKVEEAA